MHRISAMLQRRLTLRTVSSGVSGVHYTRLIDSFEHVDIKLDDASQMVESWQPKLKVCV